MKRLIVVFLAALVASFTVAAVKANDANAWAGATIDHVSCGEINFTVTAQKGPWGVKVIQDGTIIFTDLTWPSPSSGTMTYSFPLYSNNANLHTWVVQIGNAANMDDGKVVSKPVGVKYCVPTSGAPGPAGPAGPKGDKGDKGDIGASGAKGDTGASGAKGDTGASGAKGDTGAPGPAGPAGLSVKGDLGPAGKDGAPGAKGAKGDRGLRGLPGHGLRGLRGQRGLPGICSRPKPFPRTT